mgnify:CR=1 FL=1
MIGFPYFRFSFSGDLKEAYKIVYILASDSNPFGSPLRSRFPERKMFEEEPLIEKSGNNNNNDNKNKNEKIKNINNYKRLKVFVFIYFYQLKTITTTMMIMTVIICIPASQLRGESGSG